MAGVISFSDGFRAVDASKSSNDKRQVFNPVVAGAFHHPRLAGMEGGGGVKCPQPITTELTAVARRARQRSNALSEQVKKS